MTFVLLYDRSERHLVDLRVLENFAASETVERELRLDHVGERWEIVTLNAASLADIKSTHRRYFESSRELLDTLARATELPR